MRFGNSTAGSEGRGLFLASGSLSSCVLRLDGDELYSLGTTKDPLQLDRPLVIPLPSWGERSRTLQFELTCQQPTALPERFLRLPPLAEPMFVGDLESLRREAELQRWQTSNRNLPWLLMPAFLLAVGVYHLYLYGRRPGVKEYLWFGFLAVNLAVLNFFELWSSELPFSAAASYRMLEAGNHLLLVLLMRFLEAFLERPPGKAVRWFQTSHLVLALWTLLMPGGVWILSSESLRRMWGLPGWIYLAILLIAALRRGRDEVRVVSWGGLAVVLSGLLAWVSHLLDLNFGDGLLPWAFVLFTVAMAVALANRFQRAHGELDGLRMQLEKMVEDRTAELSTANERLKAEIAERQLAEGAMRMLERAVEQSIDGILVIDLEGRAQFVNQAWASLHGYEVFEVLGRKMETFHTPMQMSEEVEPCLEQVMLQGTFEGEVGHLRRDGKIFPAWTSFSLLRDAELEPVGFVAVGRDVSASRQAERERQQLEEKIQQSRKLESLGNLASGIAHDYNNLLTGILGNVNLLQRSLKNGASVDKVGQVEAAAERAVDLTSQLRSYAGEESLLLEPARINFLLRGMEGELQRLVGGSGELTLDLGESIPRSQFDHSQVRQMIRNLVCNAAEAFDDEGGRIVVRSRRTRVDRAHFRASLFDSGQPEGEYLCLEVEDSGRGINDELKAKIFDPFFTTRASARGLGLAIVLGIVRGHGGSIDVLPVDGGGTQVRVLLPMDPAEEVPGTPPKADPTWTDSGTILVVDDEELMREVSGSILEAQGFEVLTASTGEEAVEAFEQSRGLIRLVLLDRTMPGMDGSGVLANIHRIDASTAVVLMSGYKEKEAMRGLDPSLLSGFLAKPFRPADLLRTVRLALDSSSAQVQDDPETKS